MGRINKLGKSLHKSISDDFAFRASNKAIFYNYLFFSGITSIHRELPIKLFSNFSPLSGRGTANAMREFSYSIDHFLHNAYNRK